MPNHKLDLYSKPDCVHCVNSKERLKLHNIEFSEYIIGSDISLDDFKIQNPTVKSVPAFFIDGKFIGGSSQLDSIINIMETK